MARAKKYYVEVVDGITFFSDWVNEKEMKRLRKKYGLAFRIVRTG